MIVHDLGQMQLRIEQGHNNLAIFSLLRHRMAKGTSPILTGQHLM